MVTLPEGSSGPSPKPAELLHEEAVRRYKKGKYEEALGLIQGALKCEETSRRWNDYAVMQLTVKNPKAAESGLRRALELDPKNPRAAANLVVLLESFGRDGEAAHFLGTVSAELVQENREAALLAVARIGNLHLLANQLQKYVSRLPRQDPQLPSSLRGALDRSRNSESLARQCCALLARVPSQSRRIYVDAFGMLAARDPKYKPAVALWRLTESDYAVALAAFHNVFDSNPADLFAESMIIACEHKLHELGPRSSDPFEGIEEYLKEHFCGNPWKHLELGSDQGAYLCCPGWLPLCIGTPGEASAEDIWHSDVAAEVRKSILEGSFKYCSKVHCPHIAARNLPRRSSAYQQFPELEAVLAARECSTNAPTATPLPKPSMLVLSYDRTCNLACPQCRSSFYSASPAEQEQMEHDYKEIILTVAKDAAVLTLDGAGEVFGSQHSRRILSLLTSDQYPNLKISIISNGQLLDRRAIDTFNLKRRLLQVDISVDAARAETYEVVRRGGDFNRLLRNLQFLDGLRTADGETFRIILRFVVSSVNFREIPEFVNLARRFHADSIVFTVIRNRGSFTDDEFERMNVASSTNPLHGEFVEILNSPELRDPIVDMGSIETYRKKST